MFARAFADAPYARRFEPAEGAFSFFDYRYEGADPPLEPVAIDATLVGAGGVGAGATATIATLRNHVSGVLRIVDNDRLSRDNLNRVSYARVQSALDGVLKVDEGSRVSGGARAPPQSGTASVPIHYVQANTRPAARGQAIRQSSSPPSTMTTPGTRSSGNSPDPD